MLAMWSVVQWVELAHVVVAAVLYDVYRQHSVTLSIVLLYTALNHLVCTFCRQAAMAKSSHMSSLV